MAEKRMARKQQAQQMRARIQSVALDLFNKEGFENVSVEEIAQAAGCSVGNIYHYFKSKDELAIQLTDNVDRLYLELEQEYRRIPCARQRKSCWTSSARRCASAPRRKCCIKASSKA